MSQLITFGCNIFYVQQEDQKLFNDFVITENLKFNYTNIVLVLLRNCLIVILCLVTFFDANSQTGLGINTVVIDPGHGGKDPGAISPNKNYEKTVVLKVSLLLGDLIEKAYPEVEVIYTRDDDRFIGLAKRAKIANEIGACLLYTSPSPRDR